MRLGRDHGDAARRRPSIFPTSGRAVLLALLAAACGGPPPRAVSPSPPDVVDEPDDVVVPDAPVPGRPVADFAHAKKLLTRMVLEHGPRTDLYCGCPFSPGDRGLVVDLAACGYVVAKDPVRAARIEWEHAVPASVFGRTFEAWTQGDPRCRSGRGKPFRGRACARKVSPAFARIEADMHNLFPAVGEVNALRSDLPMGTRWLGDPARPSAAASAAQNVTFGACATSIASGALSPRREIRGDVARAYKYMERTYPERAPIDDAHRAMFDAWDREDPPDAWERERSRLVAAVQGAENPFVAAAR